MCLFSNFYTNKAKLIEFIQYLCMKSSQILKNGFVIIILRWHPPQQKQYCGESSIDVVVIATHEGWNFALVCYKKNTCPHPCHLVAMSPFQIANSTLPNAFCLLEWLNTLRTAQNNFFTGCPMPKICSFFFSNLCPKKKDR
jgi:hypothetical protein